MNKSNRRRAFTFGEILIVVIVIGVLAAIALPKLIADGQRTRMIHVQIVLDSFQSGIDTCSSALGHPCTQEEALKGRYMNHLPPNDYGHHYSVAPGGIAVWNGKTAQQLTPHDF